jgi:hypothetical protein
MTLFEITAATILALTSNAGMNGKYVYNTEFDNNNVVTSQTVYDEDYECGGCYLTEKMKYNFAYDDQQRLTSKETLKWNAETSKWENDRLLRYNYDSDGYTVEFAYWNKNSHAYSDVKEKCSYSVIGDNLLEVATYKWNGSTKSFEVASRDAIYDPNSESLMAGMNLK